MMEEERDLKAEMERLKQVHPDVEQIPDEVAKKMMSGTDAVEAYEAFLSREGSDMTREYQAMKQELDTLKKENRVLKQNAGGAARSIGGGVSNGAVDHGRKDSFLVGLESDGW